VEIVRTKSFNRSAAAIGATDTEIERLMAEIGANPD
jgi:hypothetical protein